MCSGSTAFLKVRKRSYVILSQYLRSGKWLGKIETYDLRLDVLCFVCLCKAYGIKASRLIRKMEKEPSEDDGSFFSILRLLSCQF